jgi:hypothetical protein
MRSRAALASDVLINAVYPSGSIANMAFSFMRVSKSQALSLDRYQKDEI